jgi:ABC-2 type transport system ATP-binding protein
MVEGEIGLVQTKATQAPRQQGEAIVSCQRLSKVFKDFWMRDRARAVDSLDLQVYPHEIFGLLGPNGSGKSTTIKMILGLLKPSSGRVSVFGKLPSDVATKKRIGYLPEESYLYGFLNARETLDYYAKLFELDSKTRAKRIDELLDMVGLTGAQFRPVREYSKGMQRRIGIAQALINDPDLLILDEPTTGLDPLGSRQVKDLILELGRRGKTVILCSHLLSDVEDCVDRMVILYGGKIRAEGTCDQLLESQSRMTIETEPLDEATVAELDRVIRSRSRGEQSIVRVSKPRQRLEDLFLDIVEKAKADHVETAGATSGGKTASFLAAREGDALIEQLIAGAPETAEPTPPTEITTPIESPVDQADSVIGKLLAGEATQAPPPPVTPPSPAAKRASTQDVDRSVIDSLLGDQGEGRGSEPPR